MKVRFEALVALLLAGCTSGRAITAGDSTGDMAVLRSDATAALADGHTAGRDDRQRTDGLLHDSDGADGPAPHAQLSKFCPPSAAPAAQDYLFGATTQVQCASVACPLPVETWGYHVLFLGIRALQPTRLTVVMKAKAKGAIELREDCAAAQPSFGGSKGDATSGLAFTADVEAGDYHMIFGTDVSAWIDVTLKLSNLK